MKLNDVNTAREEALRVVQRCDEWLDKHTEDDYFKEFCDISGNTLNGAVKRSIQEFVYSTRKIRR